MSSDDSLNPYRPPSSDHMTDGANRRQRANEDRLRDKFVVVSTFYSSIDAHLFRNELESNGIKATVNNETTAAIFGATIAGPSSAFWIEVLVIDSDADRALEIKDRWLMNRNGEEVSVPEWVCGCGETVDEGFAVCWNCEAEFENNGEPE